MSVVTVLMAETDLVALPIPTWAYGVISLVVFFALAFVLWNYRDVSNRHQAKADAYAAAHGGTPGHAAPGPGSH
jgi:heme/copper-type cytochrome/quinol oxidase subunit 2